ncbi:MAG: RNA 2',3'-cyclic phosphodiesterase, partial [Chloroflexota bacterium]
PLGWLPEDRPYAAHLTVARAEPGPAAAATAAALIEAAASFRCAWHVDALVLYESRLAPGGARYVALERVPLGPGEPAAG